MRTSPAVPGVFGGFGGQAKKENFSETLDGWLGLLHNLASLLQTDRKRRRGEGRSSLTIWTTDRCGCLDASDFGHKKVLKAITRMERSIEVEVTFYRQ